MPYIHGKIWSGVSVPQEREREKKREREKERERKRERERIVYAVLWTD